MKLGQKIRTTATVKHIRDGKVIGERQSVKEIPVTQKIIDLYNKLGKNLKALIRYIIAAEARGETFD